jgi:hypothetical protein
MIEISQQYYNCNVKGFFSKIEKKKFLFIHYLKENLPSERTTASPLSTVELMQTSQVVTIYQTSNE